MCVLVVVEDRERRLPVESYNTLLTWLNLNKIRMLVTTLSFVHGFLLFILNDLRNYSSSGLEMHLSSESVSYKLEVPTLILWSANFW